MRLGEVLGLSWNDIDFSAKRITLRQQIRYISKRGHYFMSLKTESSKRYIITDDFLLNELRRWQTRQAENEKQFGDSYVYTYRESDGHIQRQSKGLAALKGVAGRLGHAHTQITQNFYTHNTLKLQKETAAIFAENLQTNS